MTDFDAIFTTLLAWVQATVALEGLSPVEVVQADQPGPRSGPASLSLRLTSWNVPAQLTGRRRYHDDGVEITKAATGTLSVQGYGAATRAWVEALGIYLDDEGIMQQLEAGGLVLRQLGGAADITELLDTSREVRIVQEFAIDYDAVTGRRAFTSVEVVEINPVILERYPGAPDPLVLNLTITT